VLPQTTYHYHVTLLRHAQSEGNARGILQGQSDFPLSEIGIQQAEALAHRWKKEHQHFDCIISSPLSRAQQTAEIIAAALGAPLELDDNWMERNNGQIAGLRPEEVDERGLRPPFVHLYQPIGLDGESQWELFLRAGSAVQDLLHRPPGKYLVVSHGGILNLAMYVILGIVPQANFQGPRFRFRNAAFASLEYDPSRHVWSLESINDRAQWHAPN
jgi:2,3-bisphosphoglycerate-dependent phosphoglycerate mutase